MQKFNDKVQSLRYSFHVTFKKQHNMFIDCIFCIQLRALVQSMYKARCIATLNG